MAGTQGAPVTLTASAVRRQLAVMPNNGTDLPSGVTNGIAVNADGNIAFHDADGNVATRAVFAGYDYPWEVRRVLATGTTATGIYALYSR